MAVNRKRYAGGMTLSPDLTAWLIYLALGVPVGFLMGLLGIGGGSVVVPVLALAFEQMGFPRETLMQVAIATSLACIVVGSPSSIRAHHAHGAVLWPVVKLLAPGLVVGGLLSSAVAHALPSGVLRTAFALFMLLFALQIFFKRESAATRELPGTAGMLTVGGVLGLLSGLVGIGGAVLSIAFLTHCAVPMKKAVGTAAAIGWPIAAAGTLGFVAVGWFAHDQLPKPSLGYIFLPAWIGISLTSSLLAPVGARLAHRLPTEILKRIFVVFLLILSARLLWPVMK